MAKVLTLRFQRAAEKRPYPEALTLEIEVEDVVTMYAYKNIEPESRIYPRELR